MPRPQRCRTVCEEPEFEAFSPEGIPNSEPVTLKIDEYEIIRLIDLNQLTHAEAARIMDISRPTATEIYNRARIKIADCIVNGKKLVLSGGNYRLCQGGKCKAGCKRQLKSISTNKIILKGNDVMRIAVTYENGNIFQHFGHTAEFKFYDEANGEITNSAIVSTNGSGHGALAEFLKENKVDVLICGGIGGGAQNALSEAGIKLFGGVSGSADEAVKAYLSGNLNFNPNVKCNHHKDGSEGHTCSSHGCGSHSCH